MTPYSIFFYANKKKTTSTILRIFLVSTCFFQGIQSKAQTPVKDRLSIGQSKIMRTFTEASEALVKLAEPIINTIQKTQEFMDKADKVVNGVIKNLRTIQHIIDIEKDIKNIFNKSIAVVSDIRDTGNFTTANGTVQDGSFINSVRHINILIGLLKESIRAFDLLYELVEREDNQFRMDDYNRMILLLQVESDLLKIRRAMIQEVRRINQEFYVIKRLQQEIDTYKQLFAY